MCRENHESKGQSMKWKSTDSPAKKKYRTQWTIKKVVLTAFKDMKKPITTGFLEKGATVKSTSY